jgi:hypothetical protein
MASPQTREDFIRKIGEKEEAGTALTPFETFLKQILTGISDDVGT